MGVRKYKPTSAGRRQSSVDDFSDITKSEPEKSLIYMQKRINGRNNQGKITVRHRGGGARKYKRIVDFKLTNYDSPATVTAIEYDPNRGARLALVFYKDGKKAYIVQPLGLKVGDTVMSSKTKIEPTSGNRMPLEFIPEGLFIHNIELEPGRGGILVRAAGVGAQLLSIDGDYAIVRMPSTEVRKISKKCMATIGMVGNPDHRLIRWGKAGRMRLKGIRPSVRGKAMNPVDHPHGGGEGKHPIGMKHPKTLWGKPALGVKSRKTKKMSTQFIISRRQSRRKK